VSETHLFQVGDEFFRHLPVTGGGSVREPPPRSQVEFVDGHRFERGAEVGAAAHPGLIAPGVLQAADEGGRFRGDLALQCKGVGLVDDVVVMQRLDVELVARSLFRAGDEAAPDAGIALGYERVLPDLPRVEIADDIDRPRGGSPDREANPGGSVDLAAARSELLPQARVRSRAESPQVGIGKTPRA